METNVKPKVLKVRSKQDWKPLATEMGVLVLRGLITGFTMQAGIMIFNKSFIRNTNNLLLIDGGKKTINA